MKRRLPHEPTRDRVVAITRKNHPDRTERWVIEKVLRDSER